MNKIVISTIAAASLVLASSSKYEITPMIGYVDTKEHVDLENHATFGVAVSRNMDDDCKFDKIELGLLHSNGADYENSTLDTNVNQLFVNGVKEYKLNDKFKLYALAGLGYEKISDSQSNNDSGTLFNYGVGAAYSLTEELSLKLDARHQLKFDGDRNLLYTLGLSIPFGEKGTKVVELDSDNDGVLDSNDKCPTTKPGIKVDTNGCELDSDNDGVVDSMDKCPTTPTGTKVDATGCAVAIDSDNDGVLDSNDKCPTTKPGIKVDTNGCELDSDNDGVVDSMDKCPTSPTGTKVDTNGCEVLNKPADLGIIFETNSDKIKSSDLVKFDKYVTYLKAVEDAKVVLEAHTDSIGNAAYNLNLSQKRANSTKKQLVEMGIDETRIEAIGYGETKPKVSNDTAENRQLNRRVTARIVK